MSNDLIQKNAELGRFLFCERYTLQPVKNALYIAEGQDLKRGAVVDVNGVLVGTNSLMPYAVLENDCDTRAKGAFASVFVKGEFNFDKLSFADGLSKEQLDNIVYNGNKVGIVIKPYTYSLDFSPKTEDIDKLIPESASEENKLATASDVAGVQEDVDSIEGKIPSSTSATNKLVNEDGLQTAIDAASESWSTGFTPKGESSVSDLNNLTTQSNGDSYIVTDSGTLTDGSIAVVAGDQVAWDTTNSVWYKLPQYALEQFGTNAIKDLATTKYKGFMALDDADGTGKMDVATIFNNFAPEFVPSDKPNPTTTVAGQPYVYNGSLYVAKESGYQGPWASNKFIGIDIATLFGNLAQSAAKNFSPFVAYLSGETVSYLGETYVFKQNHAAGSWNPSHVLHIPLLSFATVIKRTCTEQSTIYLMGWHGGDSISVKFESSNWANTSGSPAVVISFLDAAGSYTYYKSHSYIPNLLADGLVVEIPADTLYGAILVRVDAGTSVTVTAHNNGCNRLYGFCGDVQGADLFENGNISMSSSGNTYSASTTRVRTKGMCHFYKGDTIKCESGITFYINTKAANEADWTSKGWLTGEYIVDRECDAYLVFRLSTEATVSVDEICSKFVIKSEKSSFTAASRLITLNAGLNGKKDKNDFAKEEKILSFVGAGNSIRYSGYFGVTPGKIYKVSFPNFDATGVTANYLLRDIEFEGNVPFISQLKTDDSVSAIDWFVFIPYNVNQIRVGLRAKSGESITVSVSEYKVEGYTSMVRNVGHRGSSIAIENTVSAYRLSAAYGYKYVETDVRLTSDGYLVCLHDETVDRISNGTGNVSDLTLAQVKALTLKGRTAFFADSKIATLREVLQECKSLGLHLYLDVKVNGHVQDIIDEVNEAGMTNNVSYMRGDFSELAAVKAAAPSMRISFPCTDVIQSYVDALLMLSQTIDHSDIFFNVPVASVTAGGIALAEAAKIDVELWIVAEMSAVEYDYVSGISSDSTIPPSYKDNLSRLSQIVPTV